MVEFLHKLFWVLGSGFLTLVGLAAGVFMIVFMIGFGFCATQGAFTGLGGLARADSVVFLILAAIGAGLAWGFFKLARHCARQIPGHDDAGKADSP